MASTYDDLTTLFKALAHPVRLQILDMLRGGEVCVCHMETAFGKRQAYISQQLMILREAGLVTSRKDGLKVFYRIIDPVVYDLLETTLGPAEIEFAPVTGCPCPDCAVAIRQP